MKYCGGLQIPNMITRFSVVKNIHLENQSLHWFEPYILIKRFLV